jgi:putative membrane protein
MAFMTKYFLPAIILTLISCTKTREDDDAVSDEDFVLQASVVNTTEIDIGSLASTKGIDEGVKAFGQSTTGYHKAIQTQLKSLATTLNLVAADSLDVQHIALKNQLLDLSGHAFDSLYILTRVQDYRQATKLFFQEVISGQSSQLRAYSASVLPQLEVYLRQADSLLAEY